MPKMQKTFCAIIFSFVFLIFNCCAHPVQYTDEDQISIITLGQSIKPSYTHFNEQNETLILLISPKAVSHQAKEVSRFVKRTSEPITEGSEAVCEICGGKGCSACRQGTTVNRQKDDYRNHHHHHDNNMHSNSNHATQSHHNGGNSFGSKMHEGAKGDPKHS
jgi:hypothetical protein